MNTKDMHDRLHAAMGANVRPLWAAAAVCIVALTLRLLYLNMGFFHHDAILLVRAVQGSVEQGTLLPVLEGRYAHTLVMIPLYWLLKLFGLPVDVGFNVATAVMASLASGLLVFLARRLTRRLSAGIFAGLLLAFTPVFLSATTHTTVHGFSVLLVVAAFLLLDRGNEGPTPLAWLGAALCMLAAVSARFPNILLLAPAGLLCLDGITRTPKGERGPLILRQFLFFALPLIVTLGGLLAFQAEAIMDKAAYDAWVGPFSPALLLAAFSFVRNIGVLGLALFAGGLLVCLRHQRPLAFSALLAWLVIPIYFYGNVATYGDRFLCVIFPPTALFMAVTLAWIADHSRPVATLLLLGVLTSMLVTAHPVLAPRHAYSGEKEFAAWVGERTEPNAIVLAMDEGLFIEYYGNRQVRHHPTNMNARAMDQWMRQIKNLAKQGIPVYAVETAFTYDPNRLFAKALDHHFTLALMGIKKSEDYHKASLESRFVNQRLFRLMAKPDIRSRREKKN